ncbi:MAG: cysteine desulfurase family protein [Saccharofermentanales bacterium]
MSGTDIIYLDYSATTPPYPEVVRFYCERLLASYANPASTHQLGQEARKTLEQACSQMANLLDCQPREIILTSGASESINTALKSFFPAGRVWSGGLAVCAGEHAATRETAETLARNGVVVHTFGLTATGAIDLESVAAALSEKPLVISYMLVNNETGAIAPVAEIAGLRNKISPRTKIHIDAVQALGRLPLSFKQSKADLMTLSGHKFGAPRGIGLLIGRKNFAITPLIAGGGQQENRRSGTENPPLAEALVLAMEKAVNSAAAESERIAGLERQLNALLFVPGSGLSPVCTATKVPHIVSIRTPGLRGETLANALSAEGIMISAGSACAARKAAASPILRAMGLTDKAAREVVRISLGRNTGANDIEVAAAALLKVYNQLSR